MPLDVICPGCGESYHETTKSFNPDIEANAGMIRLKEPWKSWGWTEPPPDPTAGYGLLECPGCEAQLAPSGHLKVKEQDSVTISFEDKLASLEVNEEGEIMGFICPVCQRKFKTNANLGKHMRVHKHIKERI